MQWLCNNLETNETWNIRILYDLELPLNCKKSEKDDNKNAYFSSDIN